ncbi:MAG: nucleotidyl transferase AbiEii/AbiGii toxin family protein [Candidatus Hadarchaeales archaeon]
MFLGVRCWRKRDLTRERMREVGARLGLPPSLVEREVIFYDTLQAVCSLSPVPLVLKGGTLISRLYSECPRFSWDIDLSASLRSKEEYDLEELNRRMKEGGRISYLEVGEKVEFGRFERDQEKDVFFDLLSLKRDMVTFSLGAPLPLYLRKGGRERERGLRKLLEALGFLPFVDSVRLTVSLEEPLSSGKKGVRSLLQPSLTPLKKARASVSPPERCLLEKLSRLCLPGVALRDLLCDFYDVGQLLRLDLEERRLREDFNRLYARRRLPPPGRLERELGRSLSFVRGNLDQFSKRREFTWCRYDWKEYFSSTAERLRKLLRFLAA